MKQWAALIRENEQDLVTILVTENGKTLSEAKLEFVYGALFIDCMAEEALRVSGEFIGDISKAQHLFTVKQPVGVVALITPFVFPSCIIARNAAAALAAGCPVVIRPCDMTPLSATALAELAHRAGFPPGVFNVIPSRKAEVNITLCKNPEVRAVSFIGNSSVGKQLLAHCAETVKKCLIELGGNTPFIVFEDADWETAADQLVQAKVRCAGKSRLAPNWIFIHESVYDKFSARVAAATSKISVGAGLDPNSGMGALISQAAVDTMDEHIRDATSKGGRILFGGKRIKELPGFFFEPTVLVNVHRKMRVISDELTGPVIALMKFSSEEEVLQAIDANRTGLAAFAFTRDAARQWRMAAQLEYGLVGINDIAVVHEQLPFGGVKESGQGRVFSRQGLEEYMEIKSIVIRN